MHRKLTPKAKRNKCSNRPLGTDVDRVPDAGSDAADG
jgi:hypothetical protein